jgi:hypothetical protein
MAVAALIVSALTVIWTIVCAISERRGKWGVWRVVQIYDARQPCSNSISSSPPSKLSRSADSGAS